MQSILMEFIDLYKTSFIMIIAIIAFTIQIIVFNDPPSFPLSDNSTSSVDCFNIESTTVRIEKSRIKVNMRVKDFIQYPIEVASSMVHIESKTGDVNFSFSREQFWDLKSDLHHVSFCVLQTAAGDVEASLYCQRNLLDKAVGKIQTVDVYPVGWSRIFNDSFFSNSFGDVCVDTEKKLTFCSKQLAKIGKIRSSWAENFSVTFSKKSAADFQKSEKIPSFDDSSVLVPFNGENLSVLPNPQNFLIDAVLPILKALTFSQSLYLAPNEKYVEQLTPILGEKVRLISKSCYKKLFVLPSTGGYSLLSGKSYKTYEQAQANQIRILLNFSKEDIQKIKEFYKQNNYNFDVVLDQKSSRFLPILKELTNNIFVIDDNQNFTFVANVISSAKILIASDIKSLFFGSLMNEKSTLIEIVPDGMNCIASQNNLTSKFDVNYKILKSSEDDCICKNLDCYFKNEHKYDHVDKKTLLDLVKKSLTKDA